MIVMFIKLLFCIGFSWPWFIILVGTINCCYSGNDLEEKITIAMLSSASAGITWVWICFKVWNII